MKVAVVGPGALGRLFASKLSQAKVDTTLVDYRPARIDHLNKHGIYVESKGEIIQAKIPIVSSVPDSQDLVIVLTKSDRTPFLKLPAGVPTLTLQNGLNNAETLATQVGADWVLAGSTSEAATLLDSGRVRHVASGITRFGAWTKCAAEPAADILQSAGFTTEISDSPGQVIWEKAALSAAINPLTALINVPNGRLVEIREIRKLMRDLVVEATKVAAAEGYRFEYSLVEKVEEVCANTAENISSMLQDVRSGKPTEIESINGEMLRRAAAVGLPTPRLRMVYQLVKGLENR